MLDSARDVVDFSRGRSRVDLDSDRKLVLALVKAVEIIGEAALPGYRGDASAASRDSVG
jgi:uncharacterized protein with HEPN domain